MLRATEPSLIVLTLAAVFALIACTQQSGNEAKTEKTPEPKESNELKWARAALERNPDLKVESVDEATQAIKVRVKSTGEVNTVTPGELAAIPISDLVALNSALHTAQNEAAAPAHHVIEEPAPPAPEPPPVATPKSSELKVERDGDHVRISGPGVNIESSNESRASTGAIKKIDEPIICEGMRTLFLDRRRMNVT